MREVVLNREQLDVVLGGEAFGEGGRGVARMKIADDKVRGRIAHGKELVNCSLVGLLAGPRTHVANVRGDVSEVPMRDSESVLQLPASREDGGLGRAPGAGASGGARASASVVTRTGGRD